MRALVLMMLALGLFIGPAHAQTANGVDTSGFFNVPPWDKSNELLGIIFGDQWFNISGAQPASGQPNPNQVGLNTSSGADSGIIGAMSKILNAACLYVAVIIVLFGTTTGVMQTAHEGVALGKKYSTLWFPLRSAFAVAALAPLAGGYSMIQVGAFQATKVSIGTANTTWGAMVDYMGSGAPFGMAQVPEGKELAEGLFRANACKLFLDQQYATMGYGVAINKNAAGPIRQTISSPGAVLPGGEMTGSSTLRDHYDISFDGSPMSGYSNSICGRITYSTEYASVQSGAKATYTAQRWAAVQQLDQQMMVLAAAILNGDAFSAHASDFYMGVKNYQTAVLAAGANYKSQMDAIEASTGQSSRAAAARDSVSKGGWIYAGSFYWQLQNSVRKLQDVLEGRVAVAAVPQDGLGGTRPPREDPAFKQYAMGSMQRVALFLKTYAVQPLSTGAPAARGAAAEAAGAADPDAIGSPSMTMDTGAVWKRWLSAPFLFAVTQIQGVTDDPRGDALEKMASAGHYLIGSAETAYLALAGAQAISSGFGASLFGRTTDAVAGAASAEQTALDEAAEPIKLLLGLMMVIGVWALYWLPAIPFIMWIAACTGWMISVVQSVISAPIWAAAHAAPEGDGFAGQQARNGYMFIISLMLRPTLMLFGMIGGMLVMQAAGALIWLLFPGAIIDIVGDSIFGALSFVIVMVLLCVVMSSAAHRAFELSFELGDQILRWIGGGQDPLGVTRINERTGANLMLAFTRVDSGAAVVLGGKPKNQLEPKTANRKSGLVNRKMI